VEVLRLAGPDLAQLDVARDPRPPRQRCGRFEEGVLQKFPRGAEGRREREVEVQVPFGCSSFEQRDARCGRPGDSLIRFRATRCGLRQGQGLPPCRLHMDEGRGATSPLGRNALGLQRLDGGQFGPVLPGPEAPDGASMHSDAAELVAYHVGLNRIPDPSDAFHPSPRHAGDCWLDCGRRRGYFLDRDRGLPRVSRADLDAVGRRAQARPSNHEAFGVGNGMRAGSEFSFGVTPSAWQGGNKLYFPYSGVMDIDLARLTVNRPAPGLIESVTDGRQKLVTPAGGSAPEAIWNSTYTPSLFSFRNSPHPLQAGRLRCGLGGSGQPARAYYTNIPPGNTIGSGDGAQHDSAWNESAPRSRRPGRRFLPDLLVRPRLVPAGRVRAGCGFYQDPCARPAPERAQTGGACRGTDAEIAGKSRFGSSPKRSAHAANRARASSANMARDRTPLIGIWA